MMADSVSDGAITTAKIADGAVTSAKLDAGVVQTANLATGAVGNAQLANSAVTINAGTGLAGGGLVSLGGAVSLSNAGVLSLTGGGGITVDAATGAITLGSSATSAGTAGAIVARDASGGFTAGTITGTLNGNAATATTATDFTGMLAGDVTGTQSATAIAATTVTGKALTGFTSAAGSVTASDTLLSAISKLDGNTALKAPLASPTFTGSVTLPAGSATAAPLLLQTGTSLTTPTFGALEFDGTNVFVTNNSASPTRKTVAFTDSTVTTAQIEAGSVTTAKLATGAVGSAQLASGLTLGGTTTGTFSGSLTGNVTGNVSGSAASFTGSLEGDVTGTQAATVVSTVGGISAANIAAGATLANNATSANTASTLVTRDASGNFSAGIITGALNGNAATATTAGSATSFTGGLTGDVPGISDLDGTLRWLKPNAVPATKSYAAGFDTTLGVLGSRYTPPLKNQRAFPGLANSLYNTWLRLSGPDMSTQPALTLTTLDRATTWTTANKLLYYGPDKITMTFTAATGLITGKCVDAGKGISVTFGGALIQKQGLVSGWYAGGARTGLMVMETR